MTRRLSERLLERFGTTYAADAGIRLRDTPAPLFRLLVLSLLASARIDAAVAVAAARALADAGWTTPAKLAGSTWEARTKVLNEAGYARYDERTSRMLGQTVDVLLDRYGGDLRRLRAECGGDPARVHTALQQFSGIGPLGASIFCREVQGQWGELYPYADDRVLETARELGLGDTPESLSALVEGVDGYVRLVAALVRCRLAGAVQEMAPVR